jgi:dynein heavy chain
VIEEQLDSYNDANAAMNLVLFEDAMKHVCRICRILQLENGHALLIGVGGSGKQSLAKLAAFINGMSVFQLTMRPGYSPEELKIDLRNIMEKVPQPLFLIFLLANISPFLSVIIPLLLGGLERPKHRLAAYRL